jgi:hypothetical protein
MAGGKSFPKCKGQLWVACHSNTYNILITNGICMGSKSHGETTGLYKKLQHATEKCGISSNTIAVTVHSI